MLRKAKVAFLCTFLFGLFVTTAHASDYKTSYDVSYALQKNGNSDVSIHVSVTHSSSKTYVSQFSLGIPNAFKIENVKAKEEQGPATVNIEKNDLTTKLTVLLNIPKIENDSANSFDLTFTQKNLFTTFANVWEIVLPVVRDDYSSNYTVSVTLPSI